MRMKGNCLICGLQSTVEDPSLETQRVECLRCGTFAIQKPARLLVSTQPLSSDQAVCASGWIREHPGIVINDTHIPLLNELQPPTVGDKATKLLRAIASLHPAPGDVIKLWNHDLAYIAQKLGSDPQFLNPIERELKQFLQLVGSAWITSKSEFTYLVSDYLCTAKRLLFDVRDNQWGYKITPDGWAFLDELRQKNAASHIGFIAMWFDKQLDPLLPAIEAGIRSAGYEPKRIDRVEHNNRIDDEIIAWIRRSKFVVADMTGNRGGVYFESGYALGMGLQVIWLCHEDDLSGVHFDNRQYNFIVWSPDQLADLTRRLQNRIEATIGRPA